MERQFNVIQWDGFHFGAVLTHWPQENTTAGTVWRFVMDRGQTLIAVPYQTPERPAPANHCVPERIEPILAAGRFGRAVQYAAGVNVNLEDWDRKTHEATEKEFTEWKAIQSFPKTAEFEALRQEYHEKNQSESLRDKINAIQKSAEYKAEKARHDKKWNEIEAACRKRIEKDKAAREKTLIAKALKELRDALAVHGATLRGDKWLRELFEFIRLDICGGHIMTPAIGAAGFARIVEKVEELTGEDITERILMECEPWRLAHESGAKGLERVRGLAVFPDGRKALIESLVACIHNGRDVDMFEKVKPSEQERQAVEKQVADAKALFDANPSGEITGKNLFITITEAKIASGWPPEKFDELETKGQLVPCVSGMAEGGKRRKKREYFRADFEKLLTEIRQEQKKFAGV